MKVLADQMGKDETELKALLDEFKKTGQAEKQKERLTQIDQAWQAFRPIAGQVTDLSTAGKKKDAAELVAGSYQQIVDYVDTGLSDLARASEDIAATDRERSKTTVASARKRVIVAAGVAVAVGFLAAVFIGSGIMRGLRLVMGSSRQVSDVDLPALTSSLGALSRGELTASFAVTARPAALARKDEIGQLSAAFDAMMKRLSESESAFDEMTQILAAMAEETRALARAAVDGTPRDARQRRQVRGRLPRDRRGRQPARWTP